MATGWMKVPEQVSPDSDFGLPIGGHDAAVA
jgi:hypothetical protein